MKKKKLPSTSLAANKQATEEMRNEHKRKIVEALKILISANYELIAEKCKLDRHQVGRRIGELEEAEVVYKPGIRTMTSSGRLAFNYSLVGQPALSPAEVADLIIKNATPPEKKKKEKEPITETPLYNLFK